MQLIQRGAVELIPFRGSGIGLVKRPWRRVHNGNPLGCDRDQRREAPGQNQCAQPLLHQTEQPLKVIALILHPQIRTLIQILGEMVGVNSQRNPLEV